MTLDEIVSDYIRKYRAAARAEMDTFRNERSRSAAIRRATLCEFPDGKRHPHQYLIPQKLLELAEGRLQAAARRLSAAADFRRPARSCEARDRIGSWYRQADGLRHRAPHRRIPWKTAHVDLLTPRNKGRCGCSGLPR